uniref:Trimethylguanosine synthase n=1 Tax=Mycena chlorophos TaxID=658473 RepID=A0ABQ0LYU5_MYCCL|nr:Tgs1 protein [Mycena chlorophos]
MGKKRGAIGGLTRFLETANASDAAPPTKKRKISPQGWVEKYDASGLVPHYKNASEVPDHLQKYFAQRTRFLSLYSSPPGCLLDEEGWYSITPELIADRIAERCRCDTVLDAFCGVGGNAIAFAKTCERVIALDISPTRLALARHNAMIYGVADRIEFILGDYISFANSYLAQCHTRRKIDVVFLSPPWGGPGYIEGDTTRPPSPVKSGAATDHPSYSLASIQPIPGAELFKLSRKITGNIAYYLPRNTRLDEIGALLAVPPDEEMIEVEEQWMGSKLKAITCFTGGLVDGQQHLFDNV